MIFIGGFITSWWGAFEFATTLAERGIIQSPVWSGTFGYPTPHHYIIGFLAAGASIIILELKRRRDREAKDRTDR